MQSRAAGGVVLQSPTIRGVFCNSHVRVLQDRLGDDGVGRLEGRMGRGLPYGAAEAVPVAEEARLIENALELLEGPRDDLEEAAGRFHYENFTATPWAKVLFSLFPRDFRFMMRHAHSIAERVFKGIRFQVTELDPDTIRLEMENSEYPLDHFKGLLAAWMEDFGTQGTVVAQEVAPRHHVYLMQMRDGHG